MGRRNEAKPQTKADLGVRLVDDLAAEWLPQEQEQGASAITEITFTFGAEEGFSVRVARKRLEKIGRFGRRCALAIGCVVAGWQGRGFLGLPDTLQTTASVQCEALPKTGSTRGG